MQRSAYCQDCHNCKDFNSKEAYNWERKPSRYVPSGRYPQYGLAGLVFASFCIGLVTTFLYSIASPLTNIGNELVDVLTGCWILVSIIIWIFLSYKFYRVAVKVLKIRWPLMAGICTFAGLIVGYLTAWGLTKYVNKSPLDFWSFLMNAHKTTAWTYIEVILYSIIVIYGAVTQSQLPFSEDRNRWYKRIGLLPVFVPYKYVWAMNTVIFTGDYRKLLYCSIYKYWNHSAFYKYISNITVFIHFALGWSLYKIFIYHDRDSDSCYLAYWKSDIMGEFVSFNNYTVPRKYAKALYKKLRQY
ncbi:MAG: hypothetical protein LBV79_09510 [Candidatus Adiutrix sp.]|jgi:hypothetical protein|nr:hypothetical protein [Candidatus Adiutrix sp.]